MTKKKKVAIIQPKPQATQSVRKAEKTMRVGAYVRISTTQEEQETSFENQLEYFSEKIKNNTNWEFVDIYKDFGKSATKTAQRDDFNKMIADCEQGKVDLILTKSVSRFARNTVDSLQAIRKLKEYGVAIIFEKEGINTLDGSGELLITILSSQAQEESRNISENTKWGLVRKYENGYVSLNHKRFLGYTKNENGELEIVREESIIVERIFNEFLDGFSYYKIAKNLTKDGIKTVTGKDIWSPTTIQSILSNEKYYGNVINQKSVTVDYLTKKRVKNEGHSPQYLIENNHDGIITYEIFREVQAEKLNRSNMEKKSTKSSKKATKKVEEKSTKTKTKFSSKYILTNLLICSECGASYRRQTWSKYGVKSAVWRCEDRLKNGTKSNCKTAPTLKEEELHRAIMRAINKVVEDEKDEFISSFKENIISIIGDTRQSEIEELTERIESLKNSITNDDKNNSKLLKLKKEKYEKIRANEKLESVLNTINPSLTDFDNELVSRLIESIEVDRKSNLKIVFTCGMVMKEKL